MTVDPERPGGPAMPGNGFGWEEDAEPDWVDEIHRARSRRAERLAELLSEPDSSPEPEDPPP
jgi:hypothetical protein